MKGLRGERLAEEIRREIAGIFLTRVQDPGLALATVTRVEVSSDGSHARVYVSFLGDESADVAGLRALKRAGSFLRGELGRLLDVRRVPELDFRVDPGMRHSVRIQQELREMNLDGAGGADDQSGNPGGGPAGRPPAGGED